MHTALASAKAELAAIFAQIKVLPGLAGQAIHCTATNAMLGGLRGSNRFYTCPTHLRKLNFMWSTDVTWEKSIGWQLTDHGFSTICGIQPAIGTLQGTRQTTSWSPPSLKTPRSAPNVSVLATNPAVLAIQIRQGHQALTQVGNQSGQMTQMGVVLQCQSLVSYKVNTLADSCDPSGHL